MKGLDFALLEQNKAKAAATSNVEDDEALEQAFFGVDGTSPTEAVETVPQPKKKSRQDLIRELKEKRGQHKPVEVKAPDPGIEEAKKAGKFKPIGFKPIGGDSEGKKRRKEKEGGDKKKKKRKVEEIKDEPAEASSSTQPSIPPAPATLPEKREQPAPEPEPKPLGPDFDIFAGVGEYTGEIGDDEDEDNHPTPESSHELQPDADQPRRGWFDKPKSPTPPPKEPTPPPAEEPSEKDEEAEETVAVRLAPLASSVSAKDILAIDEAAAKEEKRRARKEKKKKKAELNAEGKVNREYQKCAVPFLAPHIGRFISTLQVDGVRTEKIQTGPSSLMIGRRGTTVVSLLLSISLLELRKRQRGIDHLLDWPATRIRTLDAGGITPNIPLSHFRAPRNVFKF